MRVVNSEPGRAGPNAPLVLGVALGAVLLLRVLWCGVTYPESNAVILFALALLLSGALFCPAVMWRVGSVDALALLYFLAVLVLSVRSDHRWIGRDFLFQAAACTIAYLLAANLGSDRSAGRAVAAGLVAGAVLVSLYGLYQYFCGLGETRALLGAMQGGERSDAFLSRVSSDAVFSTFFYPNALAGYLIVAIPLAASLFFLPPADSLAACRGIYAGALLASAVAWGFFGGLGEKPHLLVCISIAAAAFLCSLSIAGKKGGRGRLAPGLLPIVILPVWVLSLTASEGAWLALFFSALIVPPLILRRYRLASVIVLVMLAAMAVALFANLLPPGMKDSAGARLDYWRAAVLMWRENPLCGIGPGGFGGAYARFRTPGSEEGRMPHSIYLGLAAETGVLGLIVFLCFWGSCIGALIKSQIPNPKSQIDDKSQIPNPKSQIDDKSQIPNPKSQINDKSQIPNPKSQINDKSQIPNPESQIDDKSQIPNPESQINDKYQWGGNAIPFAVTISVVAFLLHGAIDVNLSVPQTSLTLWALAGLGVGVSTAGARARRLPKPFCAVAGAMVLVAALLWILPRVRAERSRLAARRFEMGGMSGRAGEEMLKAVSIEGDNPVYWSSLAEMLEREGDVAGALAAYRQAAVLGDGIPAYHFRLAACYWRHARDGADRDKTAAAIKELGKAVGVNPHDVDYRLLLAYWFEKTGRTSEAMEEYRLGLRLIRAALAEPKRIRRHGPAEYAKLEAMVKEKVAGLERQLRETGPKGAPFPTGSLSRRDPLVTGR